MQFFSDTMGECNHLVFFYSSLDTFCQVLYPYCCVYVLFHSILFYRPNSLIYRFFMGSVFSSSVRLFWPLQFLADACCFLAPTAATYTSVTSPSATNPMVMHTTVAMLDQTVAKGAVWTAGQRGECYVAVYCSQRSRMDHKAVKDAEVKETSTSKGVHIPVSLVGNDIFWVSNSSVPSMCLFYDGPLFKKFLFWIFS